MSAKKAESVDEKVESSTFDQQVGNMKEVASATVKTFTQLYAESCEKVLAETEKSMGRAFSELDRVYGESSKIADAQLKVQKDLLQASLESAKKMTSILA